LATAITFTLPALCAGAAIVHCVEVRQPTSSGAEPAKVKFALESPRPFTVIQPPVRALVGGLMLVISGKYAKRSLLVVGVSPS
jgi:hypothetical protein